MIFAVVVRKLYQSRYIAILRAEAWYARFAIKC